MIAKAGDNWTLVMLFLRDGKKELYGDDHKTACLFGHSIVAAAYTH